MTTKMRERRVLSTPTELEPLNLKQRILRAAGALALAGIVAAAPLATGTHRHANARAQAEMAQDGFIVTDFRSISHRPFTGKTYSATVALSGGSCHTKIHGTAETNHFNTPTEISHYSFPESKFAGEHFNNLADLVKARRKPCV